MSRHERRNVLMVSWVYYPSLLVGSHRAGKFCQFLPEFGWQPTVLTTRSWYYDAVDYKLSERIPPDIEVVRTGYWSVGNFRRLARSVRNHWTSSPAPSKGGASLFRKSNRVVSDWLEVPESIGWLPFGYVGGLKAARRSDVIWATSPWAGSLCLGAALARASRKPFVADLRDPWRIAEADPYPTPLHKYIDARWERFVFNAADKIVVVTPEMQRMYIDLYPKHAEKISVVYNGFDGEDFQNLRPFSPASANEDALKIGYVGTLYSGREECMRSFLEAVREIGRRHEHRKIRVYYRGPNSNVLTDMSRKLRMTNMLDCGGMVSHEEALSLVCGMDINLLLGSEQHGYALPGKLFEYIGAKKPILAVTPGGAIRDFVTQHGLGTAPDPSNPTDVANQIDRLVDNHAEYVERFASVADAFEKRRLTGDLAAVLESARRPADHRSS